MRKISLLFAFGLINYANAARERILPGNFKDVNKMRLRLGPNCQDGTIKDVLKYLSTCSLVIPEEKTIFHFFLL